MSNIKINFTTITTEVVVVLDALNLKTAEAQLLGRSGEALERFTLTAGINHLSLKNYTAGGYSLRVSTDNEVAVKEIIIGKQNFESP